MSATSKIPQSVNRAVQDTAMTDSRNTSLSTPTTTKGELPSERIQRYLTDPCCTTPYASLNKKSVSATTANSGPAYPAETPPWHAPRTYPFTATTPASSSGGGVNYSNTYPGRLQSNTHTVQPGSTSSATQPIHPSQPTSTVSAAQSNHTPPQPSTYPPSVVRTIHNMRGKVADFDEAFNKYDQQ